MFLLDFVVVKYKEFHKHVQFSACQIVFNGAEELLLYNICVRAHVGIHM